MGNGYSIIGTFMEGNVIAVVERMDDDAPAYVKDLLEGCPRIRVRIGRFASLYVDSLEGYEVEALACVLPQVQALREKVLAEEEGKDSPAPL